MKRLSSAAPEPCLNIGCRAAVPCVTVTAGEDCDDQEFTKALLTVVFVDASDFNQSELVAIPPGSVQIEKVVSPFGDELTVRPIAFTVKQVVGDDGICAPRVLPMSM